MKTKIAFLAVVLTFLMIRVTGLGIPEQSGPSKVKSPSPKPPTFEAKTSGLDIKVWIMTQKEHEEMMEGMKGNNNMYKDKDKEGMGSMDKDMKMSGAYHMKVMVTDLATGAVRNGLDTKVEVTSPSNMNSTISLANMSDHYGSDLILKEKGQYKFMINIDDNGVTKSTEFKYNVR
jgi:hypothetical protein